MSEDVQEALKEVPGNRRPNEQSLSKRVVHAGFWSFLFHGLVRGIGFVRNIALARILAPDDFGLFGITVAILSILERFSQTGLRDALIQKKEDVDDYLDAAWTVEAIRGTLLAAALFLGAGYIADFFDEPRARALIQLLAVAFLFRGLQNVGLVQFTRDLEMRYQYLHRFGSRIIDLVVSVVLALILKSAWALMIGLVAGRFAGFLISYMIHPYRPRFRVDLAQTIELSRFGRWVFLYNVLGFFASRGDNLVIGKFLGTTALGIYTLAYSISEVITVEISRIMNEVAFPAYSRAQGDLARVRRGYLVGVELVTAATFPAATVFYFLSVPLVDIILGAGWTEVANVLPALAIAGGIGALSRTGQVVYRGIGRPGFIVWVTVFGVLVTYASMFALIPRYGLVGVAYCALLGQLAVLPITLFSVGRLLDIGFSSLALALSPAILLSGIVTLTVLGFQELGVADSFAGTTITIVAVAVAYAATSLLLWRGARSGPLRLMEMLKKRGKATPGPVPEPATA